jgi:hypothetical protein
MRHNRLLIRLAVKFMQYRLLFALLLPVAVSACLAAKPAPEAFTDAEEAIEAAIRAGAEEHSPVELRFAREKLAEAREGMELRQYDKAIYLIEQSEINSELAIEKSRTAIARVRVAETARANEILKEDFRATFGEEP